MEGAWHDGRKSKQQSEAIKQYKQEAAMRRERALAYASTHQVSFATPPPTFFLPFCFLQVLG